MDVPPDHLPAIDVSQKKGTTDKTQAVGRVGLFEGLSGEQLAALSRVAETRRARKGLIIFQAGAPARGFYAVAAGRVRIFRTAPSGKEHILHVFGPGEAFAEVAVFSGQTYPADAQAMEDTELLFFPKDRFRALLRDDPDLALAMLGLLSLRLRLFVRKIEDLSLREVPARLAAHLLLLRSQHGKSRLKLDLPKGQLAAFLGTIPETLSRILRKMADDGLIGLDGGAVIIHDAERLALVAEGGKAD